MMKAYGSWGWDRELQRDWKNNMIWSKYDLIQNSDLHVALLLSKYSGPANKWEELALPMRSCFQVFCLLSYYTSLAG